LTKADLKGFQDIGTDTTNMIKDASIDCNVSKIFQSPPIFSNNNMKLNKKAVFYVLAASALVIFFLVPML
jgi:hypothetical protein